MNRWLWTLALTFTLLLPRVVFGVDFGGFDLRSYLDQKLDLEMALEGTEDIHHDQIFVGLASEEDYHRAGVQYAPQLTYMRFEVEQGSDGRHIVAATSVQPMTEPFLNFILEVTWPSGRVVREFAFILDPPIFDTGRAPPVVSAPPSPPPAVATKPKRAAPRDPRGDEARGDEAKAVETTDETVTQEGDTLWPIALEVRPGESVSVQQTMLALQRLNPGAFINRNINLLKVGYRLQIPDLREIRSFSNGAALSEVKRQNLAFQDYKAGRLTQLDGRRTSTAGSSLPSAREDGELRLVAPPLTQRSEADGDSAAASASLAYELAGVKEELDQARRSNAELNAQAGELSRQLETLSEIISLKDEQLAALRGQLRRARDDESLLETMKAMYEQAMEDLEDMYEQAMEDLEDIEDLDDLTRVSGPLLWAMIAAVLVAITLVVLLLRSGSTRSGREEGYSSLPAGWEDDELSESYTVSPHEGDELSQSYAVSQQEGENKRHDEQQAPQLSQLPDPAADPSPGTDMPSISARQDAMDGDNSGKLELAKAYMEMGDSTGARALLNQVLAEGNPADTAEASELLGKLG